MTSKEALEAELESIDEEIDELSSTSSGFKLSAEIERLRSALLSRDSKASGGPAEQFTSAHERAERIRALQRERERILRELSKYETPDHDDEDAAAPQTQDQ